LNPGRYRAAQLIWSLSGTMKSAFLPGGATIISIIPFFTPRTAKDYLSAFASMNISTFWAWSSAPFYPSMTKESTPQQFKKINHKPSR
jgi:hypothetical protein